MVSASGKVHLIYQCTFTVNGGGLFLSVLRSTIRDFSLGVLHFIWTHYMYELFHMRLDTQIFHLFLNTCLIIFTPFNYVCFMIMLIMLI